MKKILLCAALTLAASTCLHAQTSPNREGIGEVSNTPPSPGSAAPATPDKSKESGDPQASSKSADEHFIHKAGKAGKMEVKVAQQGADKSSREDLKAFASMLVKDHTAANMELAVIAKSLGVDVPEPMKGKAHEKGDSAPSENDPSGRKIAGASTDDPKKLAAEAKHHALMEKTGAEFDAVFMEVMEECHTKDIALFEKAESEVKSPELKGFITKTLPTLKKHAEALAALDKKDPNRLDAKTGN